MSQEQLHKPEAFGDVSTNIQEQQQEQPKSPMPSPVSEQQELQGQKRPASPVSEQQELQEQKPHGHAVTYGDVFPGTAGQDGPLAGETITTEDASLMQTAEAMAFGHTLKGGAASAMQSAAAKNVEGGWIAKDAHSRVSEYGLSVTETSVPGVVMDIEYVAGQAVSASARPTPTVPSFASLDAITIGEALEAAAMGAGERPIEDSDARAIESAERRATGVSMPIKGGIGATAQSAAQLNHRTDAAGKTTLSDVLMDATSDLPADKVVTYEDAYRVLQAELRGRNVDDLQPGGVGATLVAAADLNEQSGLIPPPPDSIADGRREMDSEGKEYEEDAELHKYQKLESAEPTQQSQGEALPTALGSDSLDSVPTKAQGTTEEETTPIVSSSNNDEQVPSHGSEELHAPKQTAI